MSEIKMVFKILKVKKSVLFLAAFFILGPLFSAGSEGTEALGIRFAERFSIKYMENNVKLVTDSAGRDFLLVPEKQSIPDCYKTMKNTMLVRTPVKKTVLCSGAEVSFLKFLDRSKKLYSRITAVTIKEKDWDDELIRSLMRKGKIVFLPSSMEQEPSAEKIIELKPDAVFPSGLNLGDTKMSILLRGAGIPAVSVGDYTEPSEEGYMEWIKFYGAFFNMDREAHEIFNEALKEKNNFVKQVEDEINRRKLRKPDVALGFLYYVNGLVYTQSGFERYAKYIKDSGGSYVMADGKVKGAVQIGMEEFFNRCKNADVLIYSSDRRYTPSKRALAAQEPLFREFKAFKTDRIYLYDKSYYLNSAELKGKIEDMVYILHPELMPGHRLRHYEKLPD